MVKRPCAAWSAEKRLGDGPDDRQSRTRQFCRQRMRELGAGRVKEWQETPEWSRRDAALDQMRPDAIILPSHPNPTSSPLAP